MELLPATTGDFSISLRLRGIIFNHVCILFQAAPEGPEDVHQPHCQHLCLDQGSRPQGQAGQQPRPRQVSIMHDDRSSAYFVTLFLHQEGEPPLCLRFCLTGFSHCPSIGRSVAAFHTYLSTRRFLFLVGVSDEVVERNVTLVSRRRKL